MTYLIALLFALAICVVIEFVVPLQIAIFYSMMGEQRNTEPTEPIKPQTMRNTKFTRFFAAIVFATILVYFTMIRNTFALIALMFFLILYLGYISFIEIRAIRDRQLRR